MGKLIDVGQAFETAMYSGDKAGMEKVLHESLTYEMLGQPPIGGVFEGRDRVMESFENREAGLGPGFEYQQIGWNWHEAPDSGKVFVEIHEKSWLADFPDDILEVKTCSTLTIVGDQIVSIIDYTDSEAYAGFLERHREHIPKFNGTM